MRLTDSQLTPFSVILLAGGMGARMLSPLPKQYLQLQDRPVFSYSLDIFLSMPELREIVIVCEEAYEPLFQKSHFNEKMHFARPGKRRQDSVYSGLLALRENEEQLICVHDSARPAIDPTLIRRTVEAADLWDAAVLGVPVKSTIKQCNEQQFVSQTLDRTYLWEIQTPQVIRKGLLTKAFDFVHANNLTVTDDVSLVELLGKPVKIVEGSYKNVKLTTPEDMILIQQLIKNDDLLQIDHCV